MNIYIWGTGFAARELLETELCNVDVTGFIDNHKQEIMGRMTISPKEALSADYDAVIVATGYAKEIHDQALQLGFDMSKFIFVYNNYLFEDMNQNYALISRIFAPDYINIIKNRYHVIRGMLQDEIMPSIFRGGQNGSRYHGMYESDYNRLRTFEMVAAEINRNGIEGSVAELGVFKGEFARYINEAFPDRTCYLFDTFEGFRACEAQNEKEEGNCGDAFIERFRDTTKETVLQLMPFRDKIVCKQGLFPESLDGLEDTFAFVSLDVDFEQSIYDGISYFYPRLCEGGYIFVHDYNSNTLKGVKQAIVKWENKNNRKLAKVPLPDLCGTLVITK